MDITKSNYTIFEFKELLNGRAVKKYKKLTKSNTLGLERSLENSVILKSPKIQKL